MTKKRLLVYSLIVFGVLGCSAQSSKLVGKTMGAVDGQGGQSTKPTPSGCVAGQQKVTADLVQAAAVIAPTVPATETIEIGCNQEITADKVTSKDYFLGLNIAGPKNLSADFAFATIENQKDCTSKTVQKSDSFVGVQQGQVFVADENFKSQAIANGNMSIAISSVTSDSHLTLGNGLNLLKIYYYACDKADSTGKCVTPRKLAEQMQLTSVQIQTKITSTDSKSACTGPAPETNGDDSSQ